MQEEQTFTVVPLKVIRFNQLLNLGTRNGESLDKGLRASGLGDGDAVVLLPQADYDALQAQLAQARAEAGELSARLQLANKQPAREESHV